MFAIVWHEARSSRCFVGVIRLSIKPRRYGDLTIDEKQRTIAVLSPVGSGFRSGKRTTRHVLTRNGERRQLNIHKRQRPGADRERMDTYFCHIGIHANVPRAKRRPWEAIESLWRRRRLRTSHHTCREKRVCAQLDQDSSIQLHGLSLLFLSGHSSSDSSSNLRSVFTSAMRSELSNILPSSGIVPIMSPWRLLGGGWSLSHA